MSEPNTNTPKSPYLTREYYENKKKFPPEQLDVYRGEYIAWSWEGDRIVGHAPTEMDLTRQLEAAGIDWQYVVFDYVDPE
jgi:hypothetical protein